MATSSHLNVREKFLKQTGAANNETLRTESFSGSIGVIYYNPVASRTGVILQKGEQDGQFVRIINTATGAFSITFAAQATSNIYNGANSVLAPGQGMLLGWSVDLGVWVPAGTIQTGAIASAQLDPTTIQYATTTLTSAQILNLFTTAIQLVAAPGAGKALEFISAEISYVFATTAYNPTTSTNLSVKYKDKTGVDTSSTRATTGFIDQASSQYYLLRPLTATLQLDVNALNQPLVLALLTAGVTTGDGTLKVNVAYRVYTV